jgi:protein-L-isoaspartate(D-aspartate) O-methyltransferase
MAHIVGDTGHVVTIDIDEDIVIAAQEHLQAAGWPQVQVICADGSAGYPDLAPYDHIILTVSADDIAPAWRDQLKQGGNIVLPFKFTQFRSMLSFPNLLPVTDQVVLNLRKTGDHLEMINMCGAGFMPLRGIFAVQTGQAFSVDAEQRLTLTSAQDCAWQMIFRSLKGSYRDTNTGISGTYMDFWGLYTWLALRAPTYCELVGKPHQKKYKNIPSLAQFADGSTATYGLSINGSISLLMRAQEENAGNTDYWLRPFELVIRSFGPDDTPNTPNTPNTSSTPTQHLLMEIKAWHEAGRPFQWYNWNMLQNIKIRVLPLESTYEAGPGELLSVRKGSRIVFAWQ